MLSRRRDAERRVKIVAPKMGPGNAIPSRTKIGSFAPRPPRPLVSSIEDHRRNMLHLCSPTVSGPFERPSFWMRRLAQTIIQNANPIKLFLSTIEAGKPKRG